MRLELSKYLSKRDLWHLLELSHASLYCKEIGELVSSVKRLNSLFPSESSLLACGSVKALSEDVPKAEIVNVSYPTGYLDVYFDNQFHKTDAVMWEFLATMQPVNWLEIDCKLHENYPASVLANDFGMNDGWTHGVLDVTSMNCYFYFFGSYFRDSSERTPKILEYIIPFFTEAHKRIVKNQQASAFLLTTREMEILKWVKEGKGSWEISVILNCSKRTVDFHITNMKRKLGAMNRAQLIAIALTKGVLIF